MSRPQKHPRTGVYWCRKALPQALRAVVGKREITRSLRPKDPSEARKLFPEVARQIDAELEKARLHAALLSQPEQTALDDATIARLSETYFVHLLTEDAEVRLDGFSDEPRQPRVITPQDTEAGRPIVPSLPDFDSMAAGLEEADAHTRRLYARGRSDSFFDGEVDEVLSWASFGIRLSPTSPDRKKAVRALQEAAVRAAKVIRERNAKEPVVTPQEPVAC